MNWWWSWRKASSSSFLPYCLLYSALLCLLWTKSFNGMFYFAFSLVLFKTLLVGKGWWNKDSEAGDRCFSPCRVVLPQALWPLGSPSFPSPFFFLTPSLTIHLLNTEFNFHLQTTTSFSTEHAPPTRHSTDSFPDTIPAITSTRLNPGDRAQTVI